MVCVWFVLALVLGSDFARATHMLDWLQTQYVTEAGLEHLIL